ncbi:plant UBX domain-containing protein 11-like [Jatropha curcas]|uniref:plant UBX domain-containing protein 11-like n=1 Tax=Jatropha curcas TaxID=180498 RepID=UPI0018940C63|nr:plant UBX domain-containing protein 11-like [Jatropha curcas]
MENSLSELTYKGSIPEAILESKKQKKLFVVYISGADSDSIELEKSTWTDLKVAESLSKYCILLHILEGSADAANFSAIYPQKSFPSITAIGYNGAQLWYSEGFISAEVLASSLEKAWLSLHIQVCWCKVFLNSYAPTVNNISCLRGQTSFGNQLQRSRMYKMLGGGTLTLTTVHKVSENSKYIL